MVNKSQLSTKLKITSRMATRRRNKKSQGVHGRPLTPRTTEDEEALLETI